MEITIGTAISLFAVFYVVAQVIERLLQAAKDCSEYCDDVRAETHELEIRIENLKKRIEKMLEKGIDIPSEVYNDLHSLFFLKNKADDKMEKIFFISSAILGILFAFLLNIKFLSMIGVETIPLYDIIVTGLVVGGGTKPLHDLIKYIEKAKD